MPLNWSGASLTACAPSGRRVVALRRRERKERGVILVIFFFCVCVCVCVFSLSLSFFCFLGRMMNFWFALLSDVWLRCGVIDCFALALLGRLVFLDKRNDATYM